MIDVWQRDGMLAVQRLLEDHLTTVDVMRRLWQLPALEHATIEPPPSALDGYSIIHGPHALGGWIMLHLLARVHEAAFARTQAMKLADDQLTVYVSATSDELAARWVFEWVDEDAASALATWFESQQARSEGALALIANGMRTTLWAANDERALLRWKLADPSLQSPTQWSGSYGPALHLEGSLSTARSAGG